MEKLSAIFAPASKPKLAPAVFVVLSATAAACTKTVYVPVYQNFPEDTGYSRPEEPDVEVPPEEDPQVDEDASVDDSGISEFPLSAEECWNAADPPDLSRVDTSLFMVITEASFSTDSIVTLRYEEWYGKPLQKEWFYPILRVSYDTPAGFFDSYCYAHNWTTIDDFAFIVTYDVACGLDTSTWDFGISFSYLVYADEFSPCERRPLAMGGKWRFSDGVFVSADPPVSIPAHEALDTAFDTASDTAF